MYYEEKIIDGVLMCRHMPDADWKQCSITKMGQRIAGQDAELAKLRKQNRLLAEGVESVRALIDHSNGVTGLHANGDIAEWHSLQTGGHFESWLMTLNEAEEVMRES